MMFMIITLVAKYWIKKLQICQYINKKELKHIGGHFL